MDRSRYSGGPARNPPPTWSSQDARSGTASRPASNLAVQPTNLAIQPAANAGSITLKKKAVKIVGRPDVVSASSSLTSRATTPVGTPTTPALPAPPAIATPTPAAKVLPAPESPEKTFGLSDKEIRPAITATPTKSTNVVLPVPKKDSELSLEELFARLSARSPTSDVPKAPSALGDLSKVSIDHLTTSDPSKESTKTESMPEFLFATPAAHPDSSVKALHNTTKLSETISEKVEKPSTRELNEIEREYLRKASEYVSALPASNNTPGHLFKTVSAKFHSSYAPTVKPDAQEVDRLKARYVFAVVNFINQKVKMSATPLTADKVKGMLQSNNGSFLTLCAILVEEKYMALENLDHVVGLCKTVSDALPKVDDAVPRVSPALTTKSPSTPSNDPMDKMKLWPTQEKRDAATYRTAILKGVTGLRLSDLTPLIWGGALESLTLPSSSDAAVVKFLTPAACTAYLEATSNGIVVPPKAAQPNAPRKVIFVEQQLSPSSINDVIQSCIDGEQTRCVRASGADEDWSDAALMTLALGSDKAKRDVERIEKGKNAKGLYTIEFRFANIYHALSFRRQLMADEDWEHCNVQFATDPCSAASGVHLEDSE